MISHLKNRKSFINKVLRGVAKYLLDKNSYRATHTYEKGYLAEADILAHNFITEAIQENFPSDIIYSEEDENFISNEVQQDSFLWMIDPICGSANFIKRLSM